MSRQISTATDIIGMLERGDLNNDLTNEIRTVLKTLQDLAPPKGKVKGSVTLTLNFCVEGKNVEVESAIASKVPKAQRARSFYFVKEDGMLSVEHPQQDDLFVKPRVVKDAEAS